MKIFYAILIMFACSLFGLFVKFGSDYQTMINSLEFIQVLLGYPVILIAIFIFNYIFAIILKSSFSWDKHFPEKSSILKRNLEKPIKKISLILVRFGDEKRNYGSDSQQSIPVNLHVYNEFLVLSGYGRALIIKDFSKENISFIKTETYYQLLGKNYAQPQENLVVKSPKSLLYFTIYKNDVLYLKNYIEEKTKCLKQQ